MNILDGKKVAEEITNKIKEEIENNNLNLTLAVIKIGNDKASEIYINMKEKACQKVGINFLKIELDANINQDVVANKITELSNDFKINGILLQLPIPNHLDSNYLINLISPNKDVDGLTNYNIGKLCSKNPNLIPATPKGVITLIEKYNIQIEKKHVVIIGRSNLVGLPLFNLFLNKNATVTMCHSYTDNLAFFTKSADILVSCVGKKHLIKKDMVKENVIIIDVGINREDKIYGDVDFDNVKDLASYITPVPKGIGPMTIASLLENILQASKLEK